jgi:hypothetical protein
MNVMMEMLGRTGRIIVLSAEPRHHRPSPLDLIREVCCVDTLTSGHLWASARLFEATPFDRSDPLSLKVVHDDPFRWTVTAIKWRSLK